MKYIVNLTNEVLLIKGMTMPMGQGVRLPVVNPDMLEWPETKSLLSQKKIAIETDDEPGIAAPNDE
jgi:hypothetical protein